MHVASQNKREDDIVRSNRNKKLLESGRNDHSPRKWSNKNGSASSRLDRHGILKIGRCTMQQVNCQNGYFALVDDEDYERVIAYKWSTMTSKRSYTRYARTWLWDTNILMHRLIMNAQEGEQVDHKNGNGLDNRKDNLRLVSWQQQNLNKRSRKDRPFKQKGVRKVNDKYRAYVSVNKKQIHLGYYDTPEEAGKVVEEYMTRLYGPDYVPDTR